MTLTRVLISLAHITLVAGIAITFLVSCGNNKQKTNAQVETSVVIADRISNNMVKGFAEDNHGQIWIATFRGLNKYDGTRYHQYFCVDDSIGLPESNINSIYLDRRNRLWVATACGVSIYNGKDGFSRVNIPLKNKSVNKFLEDSHGNIFFFNSFEIYRYDERSNTLGKQHIGHLDPYNSFSGDAMIDDRDVIWVRTPQQLRGFRSKDLMEIFTLSLKEFYPMYSISKDRNHIWLYGNGGLRLFDTHVRRFIKLPSTLVQLPIANGDIRCIHSYDAQRLLIASGSKGLFLYDFRNGNLLAEKDIAFPFSTDGINVNNMFTDSRGNLWLGSEDQGFRTIYKYKDMFNAHETMSRAVGKQSVMSIATDNNSNVWMVTKHNGLCCYDSRTQQLRHMTIGCQGLDFAKNAVTHVFVDKNDHIWVSNIFGVAKCSNNNGQLSAIASYNIFLPMDFAQDNNGNVWVTTAGVYVYRIANNTGKMEQKQLYPKTFVFIPSIIPLASGKMLVSAFAQPMMEVDTHSMENREFDVDKKSFAKCIRHNSFIPTKVVQDKDNNLWIGTVSNGLLHYDAKKRHIEHIPGLSCQDVSSIELDRKGNLWISTMNGLDKLDPKTRQVTYYNEADGIGGFQFYDRASSHLKDGTLIFGGTHGITAFNPERVNTDKHIRLLFQNLKIHNQLVIPEKDAPIEESMETAKQINLGYRQNSFSISFSAIDYSDYKRIHYFYMMEGLDNQWTDAANNSEAYYSNLPSGHYTFRVKIVSNDSNRMLAERSIKVSVAPMPWNTWWAYTLYIMSVAGLAWFVIRTRNRIMTERRLTRKAEEDKEQEQRINKMNMSFFANISHEFRTPLTMILGPVEQLCDSVSTSQHDRQLLCIIDRSVKRMLRLVNQLLDFNKLENDTLRLHVSRTDVVAEMRRIMDLFLMNAEEKGIRIECHGMEGSLLLWIDADKLEKIVNNLMSNAMKHTPHGGCIDVMLDLTTDHAGKQALQIIVADTGKGLPQAELDNIFKRYYQLDNQQKGTINWGTGIGLYYARTLAELHHGSLIAANKSDDIAKKALGITTTENQHGAVFILSLPTDDNAYSKEERMKDSNGQELSISPNNHIINHLAEEDNADHRPTVLVVDDDTEVVHYLRTLLAPLYRVTYRFDAESALKAIREEEPSLILSDVVMPGMSGYELCREIKHDIQICHIPVILVTAKTTSENQVEGLESGADAYVTKPFVPKVLLAMVSSLMTNREKVKTILNNVTVADKSVEDVLSPQDKAFMDDLYRIMEKEMANSELDVNRVSSIMLMSRTKLYYKIKGLTGENPSVFFKTFKLNRAASLITEGKYNISEIAYMTGFNTLSHFSTSFKKQFGCTPSEYSKKAY